MTKKPITLPNNSTFSLRLPVQLLFKLETLAARDGRSVGDFVRRLLGKACK